MQPKLVEKFPHDLYSVGPGDVPLKKGMCFSRERSLACSRRKKEKHLYNVKKSGTTKKKDQNSSPILPHPILPWDLISLSLSLLLGITETIMFTLYDFGND